MKALHDGAEHRGDYLRVCRRDWPGLVAAASDVLAEGDTGRGWEGCWKGREEEQQPARHRADLQGANSLALR